MARINFSNLFYLLLLDPTFTFELRDSRISSLAVDGNKNEWKFMVAIVYGRYVRAFGLILTPLWVLTSANFIAEHEKLSICSGKLGVRIGSENILMDQGKIITNCSGIPEQIFVINKNDDVILVEKIHKHPNYEEIFLYYYTSNGVALLELSTNAILNVEKIGLTKMSINQIVQDDQACKVAGWHKNPKTQIGEELEIKEISIKVAPIFQTDQNNCWDGVKEKLTSNSVNDTQIEKYMQNKFCSRDTDFYLTPSDEGVGVICGNTVQGIFVNTITEMKEKIFTINVFEDLYRYSIWISEILPELVTELSQGSSPELDNENISKFGISSGPRLHYYYNVILLGKIVSFMRLEISKAVF